MLRRLLLALCICVAAGCSDDGTGKKKVNQPCLDNSDCLDNICHAGICASANPRKNGDSCGGNGECRSFLCVGGSCAQGANPAGTVCLYDEECAAKSCVSGKCAAGPKPDAGGDGPRSDARPDAARPDAGLDLAKPDAAKPDADVTAPEVKSIVPAAGSTLAATTPILVTFTEAVKPATLQLSGDLGSAAANPVWSAGDTVLTLTPTSAWPDGATRTLTLEVADLAGNTSKPLSFSFTVDSAPPTVTGISPAVDYRPWTSFTVSFSKDMNPASLALSGDLGPAKVKQWPSAKQVEIEPQTKWNLGDGKILYLEAKDTGGNPLKGSPVKHVVDVHHILSVASTGEVGEKPSLAASATGNELYASYFDRGNKSLAFVKSSDGGKSWGAPISVDLSWTKPATTPPTPFGHSSLAISGSKAYLVYEADLDGNAEQDVVFLRSDDLGTTWDKTANRKTLASGSYDGVCCRNRYGATNAIVVLGTKVYLAYESYYSNSMVPPADRSYVFARSDDDGATWPAANRTTVTCFYNDGYTPSNQIGLGVLGTTVYGVAMAAAYGPPNTYYMRFGRSDDDGKNWTTCQTIESQGATGFGQFASLAMSGFGGATSTAYSAYYDAKLGDLKFARSDNNGQAWASPNGVTVKVDGDGSGPAVVGQGTAIAIDSSGDHVYIAYYDTTNKDLKFARSDDRGATWIVRTVDSKLDVGEYPSIAVCGTWPATTVSIAYYDATNKDLKLARSTVNGESW